MSKLNCSFLVCLIGGERYVYDMKIPDHMVFLPKPCDGEVESFDVGSSHSLFEPTNAHMKATTGGCGD